MVIILLDWRQDRYPLAYMTPTPTRSWVPWQLIRVCISAITADVTVKLEGTTVASH